MNENASYKKICQKIEVWGKGHGFEQFPEQSLILSRERLPFVVGSPLDLYLPKFTDGSAVTCPRALARQTCLRQLSLSALKGQVLQASLQPLYGIFSFQRVTLAEVFSALNALLVETLGLSAEKLYVMYNSDNEAMAQANPWQALPYPLERLRCPLPIDEEAQYVKINAHYKEGIVPITNLCLICQEGACAQLDGVIYPERLQFILADEPHQYALPPYQVNISLLSQYGMPYPTACAVSQHWRTLTYLRATGVRPSAKKLGYILRKFEREAFNTFLFCEKALKLVTALTEHTMTFDPLLRPWEGKVSAENIFAHFKAYQAQTKKQLRQVKTGKILTYKEALNLKATYGLYPEVYRAYLEATGQDVTFVSWPKPVVETPQAPYHFALRDNNITDPKQWAKIRQVTPLRKAWQQPS